MRGLLRAAPQRRRSRRPSNIASVRTCGGSWQCSAAGKFEGNNAHFGFIAPCRRPRRNCFAPGIRRPYVHGDVLHFGLGDSTAIQAALAQTATSRPLYYPSHLHKYRRIQGFFCSRVWARNGESHSTKFRPRREHYGRPALLLLRDMAGELDFESLVATYYEPLYKFAFSLSRDEADACDLTQQTFYVWANKGHQLREPGKVKTWLFTTLHRQFLESRRRATHFPHTELEAAEADLPVVQPVEWNQLDSAAVLLALEKVDEVFQAPVALFYLEDCSYKEIAEILTVPMGTVKSRIARGLGQLQRLLADESAKSNQEEGGFRP
jgi:RNA polymerase sigma-70 factor (ECF subfamily)